MVDDLVFWQFVPWVSFRVLMVASIVRASIVLTFTVAYVLLLKSHWV